MHNKIVKTVVGETNMLSTTNFKLRKNRKSYNDNHSIDPQPKVLTLSCGH